MTMRAVAGGSGGGLTPGTTVITSGTNTRVLFDDNGVVGEDAGLTYVKGTGTLTPTALVLTATGYSGSGTPAITMPNSITIGESGSNMFIQVGVNQSIYLGTGGSTPITLRAGDTSTPAVGFSSVGFQQTATSGLGAITDGTTVGNLRDLQIRSMRYSGVLATNAAAPTIASAGTVAPTVGITFISGTAAIATITPPSPISLTGGQITLIPTGLFTTTTAGNIALATNAVVNRALIMTYDVTTAKWYPSY